MSFTLHSPQHEDRTAKWSSWHKELRNAFPAIMARKKHLLRTVHSIKEGSKVKLLTPGITQFLQSWWQENISFTSHSPQHKERKAKWSCWHPELCISCNHGKKKHFIYFALSTASERKAKWSCWHKELRNPFCAIIARQSFSSHCRQDKERTAKWSCWHKELRNAFPAIMARKTCHFLRTVHSMRKEGKVKLLTQRITQRFSCNHGKKNMSFALYCPQHQKGRQSEVVDTKNYATLFLQSWQDKHVICFAPSTASEGKAKWSCWHKVFRNAFPAIMARKTCHLLCTVHSIRKEGKVKLLTQRITQRFSCNHGKKKHLLRTFHSIRKEGKVKLLTQRITQRFSCNHGKKKHVICFALSTASERKAKWSYWHKELRNTFSANNLVIIFQKGQENTSLISCLRGEKDHMMNHLQETGCARMRVAQ